MRLRPSEDAHASAQDTEDAQEQTEFLTGQLREAFLIRKARDGVAASNNSVGSRFGMGLWSAGDRTGGAAAGWGPKGLAEGIGIDARRYVEGLLSLNR